MSSWPLPGSDMLCCRQADKPEARLEGCLEFLVRASGSCQQVTSSDKVLGETVTGSISDDHKY